MLRGTHVTGISGNSDVLFYVEGEAWPPAFNTNTYLPGSFIFHLTSYGGIFPNGNGQMPILNWVALGATGSYGTVEEPCLTVGKFPDPVINIKRYTAGETMIEATWKSVKYTWQGIFIGEPLAHPWRH